MLACFLGVYAMNLKDLTEAEVLAMSPLDRCRALLLWAKRRVKA